MKTIFLFFCVVIVSAAQTPDDQNTFRIAQSLEQAGEYDQAAQLYRSLYTKDSLNYMYFDALRRVYTQMKNYGQAIELSNNRLKLIPNDYSLRANVGGLYSIIGQPAASDSIWDSILKGANKNPIVYRTVANEQVTRRLFDKAIATYRRGRKEIGDPDAFANDLAYLYTFMMDYENATREYVRLLNDNEQQFDFVRSRLLSFVDKEDGLKAALKVITDEVHSRETIPLLRLREWLLMENNQYPEAFSTAQRIESLINSNGAEIFQFAERAFHEQHYTIASKAYQSAMTAGPSMNFFPAAQFGFARCIEELSSADESISSDTKGNTVSMPENPPSFAEAIALFDTVVSRYPYSNYGYNALYRIGVIRYKKLFDLDGALKIFDSLLVLSPSGPVAPTVLLSAGDIYIAQGKLDNAIKKFTQMKSLSTSSPDDKTTAQFRLAEIQFFKNNFDSTLALLQPLTEHLNADESNDALLLQYFITENTPMFTDALRQFAKGELLGRQFKASEAVTVFSSIVDLYPNAPLADDALIKKAEYSIQLRQYDTALVAYQKVLNEYKNSIEKDRTQFKIGELYQNCFRDKDKAITAYEALLEKYPYSLFADESRKRIRLLRGDAL